MGDRGIWEKGGCEEHRNMGSTGRREYGEKGNLGSRVRKGIRGTWEKGG